MLQYERPNNYTREELLKKTCGHCLCYLTDVDKEGNPVYWHHDSSVEIGFCVSELSTHWRERDSAPCYLYRDDGEMKDNE